MNRAHLISKQLLLLFSIITLCTAEGFSQGGVDAPKYSNEFLSIGVGARALGMSNSTISSVSDVTAGYWNPTGLLDISSDLQISGMHANYFANIAKYDYAAIGKRLDTASAASFSLIRFGVDDIPNTTELIDAEGNFNYDRISTFTAADYAFIFSYARKMKVPGLRLGANAKIIYRQVGDFASSFGFGIDISASYRYKDWRFAAVGRDITSTFNAWNNTLDEATIQTFELTGNEIPENGIEITLPRIILGVARQFELNQNLFLLGEVNLDVTTDGQRNTLVSSKFASIDPHAGFELGYKNTLYLRGGLGNLQYVLDIDEQKELTMQPNLGLGLRIRNIYLDYALTDIGDQSTALYSNIFSLKINLFNQ